MTIFGAPEFMCIHEFMAELMFEIISGEYRENI